MVYDFHCDLNTITLRDAAATPRREATQMTEYLATSSVTTATCFNIFLVLGDVLDTIMSLAIDTASDERRDILS